MRVAIYIDNQKIDLNEFETVEIKSSVQDVNDITKNTTDFSKNFTVPASQNNNKIFKHYYDATIENGFDARTKAPARIEIDGIVYRYGKISLLGAKVKQGKPVNYSIVFYGNLVNLKDLVGDDELSVLDLSAYNHNYDSDNVKTGLTSSLFSGSIVYPLFAKKQYYYNSNSSDNTNTSTLSNIAFNGGAQNGIIWSDLRPSIKLIKIIEAIESKYGITFTRDFFGRSEFDDLYIWVNSERGSNTREFTQTINWNGGDSTWVNLTTDVGTFNVYRVNNDFWNNKTFTHRLRIYPSDISISYKIKTYVNNELFSENQYTGDSELIQSNSIYNIFGQGFTNSGVNYTVYHEIIAPENFVFSAEWENIEMVSTSFGTSDDVVTTRTTTASSQSINGTFEISFNLPKLKIIDFLSGLFKMFKLIVLQENNTDPIYINTLVDYYSEATLYDLTRYIENSERDVERGKLLNTISYKFQDPETILNKQFKLNVGQGYGDEEAILEDENGELLDGESLEIELPFEQVVYERLIDANDNTDTNIQYGAIIDDNADPTNVKPHIHYVVNNQVGSKTVSFINDSDVEEELTGFINVPSHTLGFTTPQYSTVFGKEINEYSKEIIENTLYSNYHDDFITSIFNIKRRTFKYEGITIPYRILMKMRLNDVIKIRDDYYRINSFTYNLITNKVKFELINSFDNTLNGFVASRTSIITDYQAKTESIFVTNLGNFSLVFSDDGYGTSWISYTSSGNNIYFNFDLNSTGLERTTTATITNTDTLQEITINITQTDGQTVKFDNNVITFDNTLITWDNG